jgi:hypothetical protein
MSDIPQDAIEIAHIPTTVILPNSQHLSSYKTVILPQPNQLPKEARIASVFKGLTEGALISIGQLCDHGCITTFTNTSVYIKYKNQTVMEGTRNNTNGLWYINLSKNKSNEIPPSIRTYHANFIVPKTNREKLIRFLHAACGSPTVNSFIQAINKGYLSTWPQLSGKHVKQYLRAPTATILGHLDHQRKNKLSTKKIIQTSTEELLDTSPPERSHNTKSNIFYVSAYEETSRIHTDQTGKFPVKSICNNTYIMIIYSYDSNAILLRPMKTKNAHELQSAYDNIYTYLQNRGFAPKFHRIDNEISNETKLILEQTFNATIEIVPPHCHRRNAAERAIRTAKNHIISMLSSTHDDFPLYLWCKLIPQAEITLNLLRTSRLHPQLSAYHSLHGSFDYTRTPLAPPGIKVIAFNNTLTRESWGPHGKIGYYIGPALNHYRCYRIYLKSTKREIITDTLQYTEDNLFEIPYKSTEDQLLDTANELKDLISTPKPLQTNVYNPQYEAIAILKSILLQNNTHSVPRVINKKPSTNLHEPSNNRNISHSLQPDQHHRSIDDDNPPELIEEPDTSDDESPINMTPNRNHKYNLRSKLKALRIVPQQINPIITSINNSPTDKLNITSTDLSRTCDYNHYPILDLHPTTKLKQWQQTIINSLDNEHYLTSHNANAVYDAISNSYLEYRDLIKTSEAPIWKTSFGNELGRLSQGYKSIRGKDTIHFIPWSRLPKGKTPTYIRICCNYRPQKAEKHRTRITVGGNRIRYEGDTATPTASITTVKMHWNSVLSTEQSRYMTLDIKDFYLNSKLSDYEYIFIELRLIPEDFVQQYNLDKIAVNGKILAEVRGGMYGLKQAGKIAHDDLKQHLKPYGYQPVQFTPGLWKHNTSGLTFTLIVDDFGVKFNNFQQANHLIEALQTKYELSVDWSGSLYCGVTLEWNYIMRTVVCSMPKYVQNLLIKYKHPIPKRKQYTPCYPEPITYGKHPQNTVIDDSTPLSKDNIHLIQSIIGTVLYYGRIIDNTILPAVNDISLEQSSATQKTQDKVNTLLDYLHTNPIAKLKFRKSDMILKIHSDGSFLSVSKSRSRAGGYYYMGDNIPIDAIDKPQGSIYQECSVIRPIMGSAAECETTTLYLNCQTGIVLRITAEELGHPQPPTPVQVDNSTTYNFVHDTLQQKRSKAFDMKLYWLRDRQNQNQFNIYWAKGNENLADYFSKHHTGAHHRRVRDKYLCSFVLNWKLKHPNQRGLVRKCDDTVRDVIHDIIQFPRVC